MLHLNHSHINKRAKQNKIKTRGKKSPLPKQTNSPTRIQIIHLTNCPVLMELSRGTILNHWGSLLARRIFQGEEWKATRDSSNPRQPTTLLLPLYSIHHEKAGWESVQLPAFQCFKKKFFF